MEIIFSKFFEKYIKNYLTFSNLWTIIQFTTLLLWFDLSQIFPVLRIELWNGDGHIRRNCIIFDEDEIYAYRLMSYMKAKNGMPYEFMIYTDVNALYQYLQGNRADLLICGQSLVEQADENNQNCLLSNFSRVLILCNERPQEGAIDSGIFHPVFKYQSTEHIIREVLGYDAREDSGNCSDLQNAGSFGRANYHGKIFLVYSPAGKCYKTTFAMALADAMGKKREVLYLNLEEYTGLGNLLGNTQSQGTLSDVMYMYRRGSSGLANYIRQILQKLGHFYVIPPVAVSEDVVDVLPQEWSTFLEFVMERLGFDACVVDVGNLIVKPWELFAVAETVFVPMTGNLMEESKVAEFEHVMSLMGRMNILEKLERIDIAEDEELKNQRIAMDRIEWSSVGRLARKVTSERSL